MSFGQVQEEGELNTWKLFAKVPFQY